MPYVHLFHALLAKAVVRPKLGAWRGHSFTIPWKLSISVSTGVLDNALDVLHLCFPTAWLCGYSDVLWYRKSSTQFLYQWALIFVFNAIFCFFQSIRYCSYQHDDTYGLLRAALCKLFLLRDCSLCCRRIDIMCKLWSAYTNLFHRCPLFQPFSHWFREQWKWYYGLVILILVDFCVYPGYTLCCGHWCFIRAYYGSLSLHCCPGIWISLSKFCYLTIVM